jgi:hypothetical protein
MERPARRRIYEVAILTSKLPSSSVAVTPESLCTLEVIEGSEIEDIAELLRETAESTGT